MGLRGGRSIVTTDEALEPLWVGDMPADASLLVAYCVVFRGDVGALQRAVRDAGALAIYGIPGKGGQAIVVMPAAAPAIREGARFENARGACEVCFVGACAPP